jgi:pSer/pThr/pTyr-binding forkhead associated (FHA) protein
MPNDNNKSNQAEPASWIEESNANNGTEMFDATALNALRASDSIINNNNKVDVTTLICDIAGKEKLAVLSIENDSEQKSWIIGRDPNCDVVLDHNSVSTNHAQIIYQNERWKIVNLISTNGIMVNGQKKLTTFLSNGDKIGIGLSQIVFRTPPIDKIKKTESAKPKSKKWYRF